MRFMLHTPIPHGVLQHVLLFSNTPQVKTHNAHSDRSTHTGVAMPLNTRYNSSRDNTAATLPTQPTPSHMPPSNQRLFNLSG